MMLLGTEAGEGIERRVWLLTSHVDAARALTDPRLSTNPRHAGPGRTVHPDVADDLFTSDPPGHTQLRRLLGGSFSRRRAEQLRPSLRRTADALLDAVRPAGRADLMAEFACPFALTAIGETMGIPADVRAPYWEFARDLLSPSGTRKAVDRLRESLDGLVRQRRAGPGSDLLSTMVAAWASRRTFGGCELLPVATMLVIAGFATTRNFLGNSVLALIERPELYAALRVDPGLVKAAVNELLRCEGPNETLTARYARADVGVGETLIRKGDEVIINLRSANRDPACFPDPNRVDLTRSGHGHLAFGAGPHRCLGASLAQVEAEVAISALVRRFSAVELTVPREELNWLPAAVVRRPGAMVRGLESLPVRFVPG